MLTKILLVIKTIFLLVIKQDTIFTLKYNKYLIQKIYLTIYVYLTISYISIYLVLIKINNKFTKS